MTRRGAGAARLSALLATATIITTVASPAHAAPTPSITATPDAGTRPVPNGALALPSALLPTGSVSLSPIEALANQLTAAQIEAGVLAEKLRALDERKVIARADLLFAEYALKQAEQRYTAAKAAYDEAMARVYQEQGGVPDLGLGGLAPKVDDPVLAGSAAARDLALATSAVATAKIALDKAISADREAVAAFGALEVTYRQREAALLELRKRHADKLAEIEREQERRERELGGGYGNETRGNLQANPKAIEAMRFALSQLGKPYEWGAEGPDRYDCSGLMWKAYKTVGVSLPRVAKDQYQGTKSRPVDRYNLLPGDLVFFASDGTDAETIHHVGMYIGDGKMVNSPTTGDVVKISTVWWSRFFGATRVLPAIPKQSPTPTAAPTSSRPAPTSPAPTSPAPTSSSPAPTSPAPTSASPSATTQSPTSEPTGEPTSALTAEPTPTPDPMP